MRECLDRVFQYGSDFHLIATNNGSKDETGAVLDGFASRHPNMTVIHNPDNQGFQRPHAKAFRMAAKMGAEFFLCLNDDLLVPEGFLGKLVAPLDADQSVAISGPTGGCECLNHQFHGEGAGGREPEYCEGSLMLVRISAIQKLRNNLWCPGLRDIYGEDSSLSLFVREKGYGIAKAPLEAPHARSSTVNSDPAVKRFCQEAQEFNHRVNQVRWAYYLKHRRFDVPILIKREYAIGDVLLIEPIIQAIKKSRPLSPIYVETRFPELFASHPNVVQADQSISLSQEALVVDLNGSYEDIPQTHICEAYWQTAAKVITGLEPLELVAHVYPSAEQYQWATQAAPQPKTVLIATDQTNWPGKNWPLGRMLDVAQRLKDDGWDVIAVGNKESPPGIRSLVGRTTLMQLAALCSKASLIVTPDTSTLHIAQVMGCPTVALYGVTSPRFIATNGSKHVGVECNQSLPNAGIRHRLTGKTFVEGGAECMESISVDQVMDAIKKICA